MAFHGPGTCETNSLRCVVEFGHEPEVFFDTAEGVYFAAVADELLRGLPVTDCLRKQFQPGCILVPPSPRGYLI
jgi:hypothetical protein